MYVTLTPRYDSASPSFKKDLRAGSRFKAHPPHETISAVRAAELVFMRMKKVRSNSKERMVVMIIEGLFFYYLQCKCREPCNCDGIHLRLRVRVSDVRVRALKVAVSNDGGMTKNMFLRVLRMAPVPVCHTDWFATSQKASTGKKARPTSKIHNNVWIFSR